MLWHMTSDVLLTQCFHSRAEQTMAPVHLCFCRKGVTPAAAADLVGMQDIKLVTAHIVIITVSSQDTQFLSNIMLLLS